MNVVFIEIIPLSRCVCFYDYGRGIIVQLCLFIYLLYSKFLLNTLTKCNMVFYVRYVIHSVLMRIYL